MGSSSKVRYFFVWGKYHDTPEDMISHIETHGDLVGKPVMDKGWRPGSVTGSAEICIPEGLTP